MRRHDREIRDSDQRLNDEKELPPAPKELTSSTHSWRPFAKISAVSSAVEHYTDTVGVGSSNLPPRTTFFHFSSARGKVRWLPLLLPGVHLSLHRSEFFTKYHVGIAADQQTEGRLFRIQQI